MSRVRRLYFRSNNYNGGVKVLYRSIDITYDRSLISRNEKIKTIRVYLVDYLHVWHCHSCLGGPEEEMDSLKSFFVGKTKEDLGKSKRQLEYDLDEVNIKLKQR